MNSEGLRIKCIAHGCTNHQHEGAFIGDLCAPCHIMITTGKLTPQSDSFLGDIALKIKNLSGHLRVSRVSSL